MTNKITFVAKNALNHFSGLMYPQAVRIFTPFPKHVALKSCSLSTSMKQLLERYESRIAVEGLFPHQAEFLKSFARGGKENFIITTATGSGKSLCFWIWVLDHLYKESNSTALLCFPTQALMWSQAERLARLSEPESRCFPGGEESTPYAGYIKIGEKSIPWTIWHGVGTGETRNEAMANHEKSDAFKRARIRISTLDKANWSLIDYHKEFLKNLSCLVLDEAHTYCGVFGANVHYFLKRLFTAMELMGCDRPGIFLASATLSSAETFAQNLLSVKEAKDITHIKDSTGQRIDLVPAEDVPELLNDPPSDGLLRIVLLINSQESDGSPITTIPFMGSDKEMGEEVNAIYFSQSKFHSKRMATDLKKKGSKRKVIIYDADLPPAKRRKIEKQMNGNDAKGITVIGTSALELGVDIEGLDLCFMENIPPRRADMLQRIGRIGRRTDHPGLVIMRLTSEPGDQSILEDPANSFQLDLSRPMPIPAHLEMVKWRHMLATYQEWDWHLKKGLYSQNEFHESLEDNFGEAPECQELTKMFKDRYGLLADTSNRFWVYKGFRATASEGKIPLKDGNRDVAWIDDVAIFRDAHPEAVFLGHDLNSYRVVAYKGRWKVAEWEHPDSKLILGKWLNAVTSIEVKRENKAITTRGQWDDQFSLYECKVDLPEHMEQPRTGFFEFGIWDYTRAWQGYREIDLNTHNVKEVPLDEATQRFKKAMEAGEKTPFLFPYSYRTQGWHWNFRSIKLEKMDKKSQESLGYLTCSILEHFLADSVESRVEDIVVDLDLPNHQIHVIDSAPGGNGLSESLLVDSRMKHALESCQRSLTKFRGKNSQAKFKKYVLDLCHEPPLHSPLEVLNVIQQLHMYWIG
jgi:superfamily II DNA/RNA helicase